MLAKTSLRSSLGLLFFLVVFTAGCGGNDFSNFVDTTGSDLAASQSSLEPGQVVYGRLTVMPVMANLKAQDRKIILHLKEFLTGRGMTVSEGGEVVMWPASSGGQWRIRTDSEMVSADADGRFSLKVPPSGSQTIQLFHPTDTNLQPVTTTFSALSTDPNNPRTVIVPLVFPGPCGMTEGDDEFCGDSVQARYQPPDFVPGQDKQGQVYWGIRHMRLGTYPPPEDHLVKTASLTCPQFDGTLSPDNLGQSLYDFLVDTGDVFSPGRPFSANSTNIKYINSTCDLNVLDGTCPNENPMSDVEYKAFATGGFDSEQKNIPQFIAFLQRQLKDDDRLLLFPALSLNETPETSCLINHKGRMCGMFQVGDVSLDIGEVITAGHRGTLIVHSGQIGSFTVHNNGVFGITSVRELTNSVGVVLSSPALHLDGGLETIQHYEPYTITNANQKKHHVYVADRVINFKIPDSAKPGEETLYSFVVDNATVTLRFTVSDVTVDPPSVQLALGKSQIFRVKFAGTTPPNATFKWSLQNGTGSLVPQGFHDSQVFYTPNSNVTGEDILDLEVTTTDSAGQSSLLGNAQAKIRILDGKVTITPESTSLSKGESHSFKADLDPVPNGQIIYEWSLANNSGTLNTTSLDTTIYQASNSPNLPSTDTLNVVVKVDDGSGVPVEYGRAEAAISINDGNATISPGGANLYTGTPDGESLSFTASVSGDQHGLGLIYKWESTKGFGTIQNGDMATMTYTVTPGLQPPLTDELKLTVYLDDPAGPLTFATDSVPLNINKKIYYVTNITDVKIIDGRYYIGTWFVAPVEPDAVRAIIEVIEHVPPFIPSFVGKFHIWNQGDTDSIVDDNWVLITAGSSGNADNAAAVKAYHDSIQGKAQVEIDY